MAQQVQVVYKSDLSQEVIEGDDVQHVTLGYGNKTVQLDLTKAEAQALEEAVRPYLEAGQPVKRGESPKRPGTGSGLPKSDLRAIRAWWEHSGNVAGYEHKERGRIPQPVIDAWEEKGKPQS